ncbi:hypothetical protein OGAPHI_004770 [Ogataea philodendri]|uniref:PPM-type phosphatase domain-containing protein n=1 Tax=Ogataea philodendri TaxID=1378263 RepID=A0A9P8T3Q5_9ASCO|nr:uncharacterized protein OGAPHI_004770 [Ogataea philodendri]KAH3664056.1 hypothetical protein OGAPHI_004770 [Ogataea philodendri]
MYHGMRVRSREGRQGRAAIGQFVRCLSQHLSISASNTAQSSPITFNVSMLKVPSNYGYYSSRVNRLYNEDNHQVGILDIDFNEKSVDLGNRTDNKSLEARISQIEEPQYNSVSSKTKVFNFSIFDGHGGNECSTYVRNHLLENIEKFKISDKSINQLFKFYQKEIGGYWRRWTRRKNLHFINSMGLDNYIRSIQGNLLIHDPNLENHRLWDYEEFKNSISGQDFFKLRILLGFLYTDYQFLNFEDKMNDLKQNKDHLINSGSTATSAFFYTLDYDKTNPNGYFYEEDVLSRLVIAHVGDTRAILCDRDGTARSLTKDHHPSNPIESRRLTRYSTGLMMTDSFGEERFLNYANTRAFGDLTAKNIGVTAEPEISEFLVGNVRLLQKYKRDHRDYIKKTNMVDFGGDDCFLVLVTDGVTNMLSDQEVVDLITSTTNNKGALRGTPGEAAREVVQFVESIGGDDNATCLVIKLGGWSRWPMIDRTGQLRESKIMSGRRER